MGLKHGDWFYQKYTLTGSYVKLPLEMRAKHLKFKASNVATVSFNGIDTSVDLVAADGIVDFPGVKKSELWAKGTGTLEITAWEE